MQSDKLYDNVYLALYPRSEEENLKKQNIYFERVLDGVVFFLAQRQDNGRYQYLLNSRIGPDKIPLDMLWKSALDNIYCTTRANWDPKHDYLVIKTEKKEWSSAAILHPLTHRYLRSVFGEEYIVLPYSTDYLIAMPMVDPDEVLEGYRKDLEENPETYPLSDRLYIVNGGVMRVYPESSSDDFMPIIYESPKEMTSKRNERRKQHGEHNNLS